MAGGDLHNRQHETAELRKRIVELKDQDWSFREIAEEVDRSKNTVWKHYQAAMRQIPAAAIEAHEKKRAQRLDEQLNRIDMLREVVMDVLTTNHVTISNGRVFADIDDPAPVLAAVDRLDKLDDREAKLLNLYPKQAVSISRETSEMDAAVISLIQRARDRADAAAARINGDGPA